LPQWWPVLLSPVEMDSIHAISGPGTAFVAGLVTSLHCAFMCGPLVCFFAPRPGDNVSLLQSAAVYHGCRILSYTIVGTLAGTLGLLAFGWLQNYTHTPARFLPWALVLFFLAVAFRLDKRMPQPRFAARLLLKARTRAQGMPRMIAGGWMGAFTPLLPCAPLYAVFALALMTQSPARGAEFLFAFGLGTLPLLALAQAGWGRFQHKLTPQRIQWLQRGIALAAAIVVAMRLYAFETGSEGFFCD
jgi:sulfite exporter TauE/SafE